MTTFQTFRASRKAQPTRDTRPTTQRVTGESGSIYTNLGPASYIPALDAFRDQRRTAPLAPELR